MKKILLLSIITLFSFITLSAQSQQVVDTSDIEKITTKFSKKVNKIENMCCHYEYEKFVFMLEEPIKSSGTVAYKKKGALYWDNDSNNSSFLLLNDSIKIVNNDSCGITRTEEHLLFREIAKIVASGEENGFIFDQTMFETDIHTDTDAIKVHVTPKKKRLKSLFSSILITINNDTMMVKSIKISDIYGDVAKITLSDVVFNTKDNDSYFKF